MLMRLDDAPSHSRTLAKIIGVDDEIFVLCDLHSPKSCMTFRSTVPALKYSSAMARAARLCFS